MGRGLKNAVLLIAATAVAGLAAEGLTRWLRPGFVAGPESRGNPFWRYDSRLGWFHRPGQHGRFSRPEFSHGVSINSMGFRDPERTPPEPGEAGGPRRVLVFGDSFTWGHGVEDGQVFTHLLEASTPGVQFWNMAVSAYSTDQELLCFREYGRGLAPYLVIVMVSRNDFEGNASTAYGGYMKPRFVEEKGRLVLTGTPVPRRGAALEALSWMRRRSAFINGFAWLLGIEGAGGDRPRLGRTAQIDLTLKILDLFHHDVRASGARFAVGLVPSVAHVYFGPVSELEKRRYDAIRGWGERRDVAVLDLVPCFRDEYARTGKWLHYRHDKHWNAAGHRLAAACLKEDLVRDGLL